MHLAHLDSNTQSRPHDVTAVLKLSLFAFHFSILTPHHYSIIGTQVISQKEKNLIVSYKHIILKGHGTISMAVEPGWAPSKSAGAQRGRDGAPVTWSRCRR